MTAKAGMPNQTPDRIVEYLHRIEVQLKSNGIHPAIRNELLTELRSHLLDRVAEFQGNGSPDALGKALALLGDPVEIASEFAAIATVRAAGRSYSPARLLSAAWNLARTFGHGLSLFGIGLVGYALSLGCVVVMLMKIVMPDKVGLWVGDHGIVWGLPPHGALAHEFAGKWFIPVSAWLALLLAAATTLLLRKKIQGFGASRGSHQL